MAHIVWRQTDSGPGFSMYQSNEIFILALEPAQSVELLVTRIEYPSGLDGVSLALVATNKRPDLKVLFTALPETEQHADGIGEFMPLPVSIPDLLETVPRMLAPRA